MTPFEVDRIIEELRVGHGPRSNHHKRHQHECRFCRAYAALVALRREVQYLRREAGEEVTARAYAAMMADEKREAG